MLIYFGLYGILIASAIFFIKLNLFRENTGKKIFCIITFVSLFLLIALRHPSMGVDLGYGNTTGYLFMYEKIARMSWTEALINNVQHYERGYIIFNKFLSCFSKDPQLLIVACALISSLSVSYLIYKNSKRPLLSIVIYIALPAFFICFSGLRQAIAISITMIAFEMIKNRKPVKFVALVILASFFHSSAIVFLIAYPLYNIKQTKLIKIASFIIIPIVYVFRVPLFTILSRIFKDDAVIEDTGALTLFLVFVAIYVVVLVLMNSENELVNGTINLFWVACICQAFGGVYSTAMRIGYYFMIYLVLALPEAVAEGDGIIRLSKDYKRVVYGAIFACFLVYGMYAIYQGDAQSWYMTNPYKFFWQ